MEEAKRSNSQLKEEKNLALSTSLKWIQVDKIPPFGSVSDQVSQSKHNYKVVILEMDTLPDGHFEEDGSRLVDGSAIGFSTIKSIEFHPTKPKPLFILVVDKESIYLELLSYGLHKFPCILATGMGMPSKECPHFVKKLSDTSRIPVLALVDLNPNSFKIFRVYKYGSRPLSFMNVYLAVPYMKIVGIFRYDLKAFLNLQSLEDIMQPMSEDDQRLVYALKAEPWVSRELEVEDSLQFIAKHELKGDIEMISVIESQRYFVNIFLRHKITEALKEFDHEA